VSSDMGFSFGARSDSYAVVLELFSNADT